MPLANITAILQSLPLTVTMFAAIFLAKSWLAAECDFNRICWRFDYHWAGCEGFNQYAILALIAVGFVTIRDTITRRLDSSVPSLLLH